jgi:xylan 1,4-beta-xylosidase
VGKAFRMKKYAYLVILILSIALQSCSSNKSRPDKPTAKIDLAQLTTEVPHKGAVIAGDYPDPSVIRVGDTYWATATTSGWAPAFSLLQSKDLANWKVFGSVFTTKPEWTDGNYWAPEITKLGSTYYVYYAAKNKANGRMCLAAATSSRVQGPYKDHGPMICQEAGSIDAMPVVDERGNKFLFWKEDGNSMKLPTPIWVQPLSGDGLKLVGKPIEVIRNDADWEKELVEGPFVFKRGTYWYMFYAGSSCCTKNCSYQVGVARSKNLLGPWEKYANNPIIAPNEVWKCPGHGSVITDTQGRQFFMYHAYHAKDSIYVGRQAMIDVVEWNNEDWPVINQGKGPSNHVNGLLGVTLKNEEHIFQDDFKNSNYLLDGNGPMMINLAQW